MKKDQTTLQSLFNPETLLLARSRTRSRSSLWHKVGITVGGAQGGTSRGHGHCLGQGPEGSRADEALCGVMLVETYSSDPRVEFLESMAETQMAAACCRVT
jgi:hypothetical protein